MKRQVGNILKSVFTAYRFQTFGSSVPCSHASTSRAKQVRGEFEGSPYNGIVYTLTDDAGRPVCTPIKSLLIGKRFGYEGIEKKDCRQCPRFQEPEVAAENP